MSFDELSDMLKKGCVDYVVMAIENSIAGSIIPNYALIDTNNFHIVGEYYMKISQCLVALSGQTIQDIKQVSSHPMALLQCKELLKQYPYIRIVEATDTAEEAKKIAEKQQNNVAAIASKEAADIYGLEILAEDIQTIKDNATRFVILSKKPNSISQNEIDKVSLKFDLEHKRGSLATILNVMSDCKLNLTKIQSLPKIQTPWKYSFFVDVTFEQYDFFSKAKSVLEIMTGSLKVLGVYKNAKK
ncbi:prephenate dehydratase [Elysia marginata]|uniref:Prephenate dehydratase n=1 Tax=Elysia marginata TaxID=1093978 RepID=A0AAV4EYH5_9GAST|nr:prephenate dehydratase [Elysia marginata]